MTTDFNTEHWPVVYFKLKDCIMTDDMFEDYQKQYLNLLLRCKRNKERIILISNLSCLNNHKESIPMNLLMKQVQFNKKVYEFNRKYVIGVCILCQSKIFKNMLNLFFTLTKPASPYKLCRSVSKANKFISEKLNYNFDISIFQLNDDGVEELCEDTDLPIENLNIDDLNNFVEDEEKKEFTNYFNELSS